jgi:hypothetical protein
VFAPVSVSVAAPFFTRPPLPLMKPASPRLLLPPTVSVVPVARLTVLASVTFVLVSSVAEPLTFSAPLPSDALLPTTMPPAFRFVLPV